MIIYGFKHFRDDAAYQRNAVPELARLYRLVNQLSDYHQFLAKLPQQRAEVPVREAAVSSARKAATANPTDKDAARAVKKAEQELIDLNAQIASA